MDKGCNIFDKDFSYFANDYVTNNNIKENKGQVSCKNVTVNNSYPETIFAEVQNLMDENKQLKARMAELERK